MYFEMELYEIIVLILKWVESSLLLCQVNGKI